MPDDSERFTNARDGVMRNQTTPSTSQVAGIRAWQQFYKAGLLASVLQAASKNGFARSVGELEGREDSDTATKKRILELCLRPRPEAT